MLEDKLQPHERIRLEALSLSAQAHAAVFNRNLMVDDDDVIATAHAFEGYIIHGQEGWPNESE